MTSLFPSRVIGHRGLAAMAPENTRAGLAAAARAGAVCVEFDVQLSADGVPVLFHDDDLERTTDGHGRLVETDSATLRRLDAGRWFSANFAGERIPTLAEAIVALGDLGLAANIEIKTDEGRGARTARVALDVARRLWPAGKRPPVISSFSRKALAEAARVAPDWPCGLLVERVDDEAIATALRLGCRSLHADARYLDGVAARAVRAAGLALAVYTVNDGAEAARLVGLGVDAVFSDHADLVLAAFVTK